MAFEEEESPKIAKTRSWKMAFGSQYRQKLLKPEAEKWRLDRGVTEFLCARALFTYCKYVLFCIYDTESTDRVFLRYRYGNYQEILTDTDQKIPTRYTTLEIWRTLHVGASSLLFSKNLVLFGKKFV